jgi:hypothetical protein
VAIANMKIVSAVYLHVCSALTEGWVFCNPDQDGGQPAWQASFLFCFLPSLSEWC